MHCCSKKRGKKENHAYVQVSHCVLQACRNEACRNGECVFFLFSFFQIPQNMFVLFCEEHIATNQNNTD